MRVPAGGGGSDAGSDVIMARWLQSAGLQHLASPLASTGIDHHLLPNLFMQVTNPIIFY
jgi:kinesin family protein 2/24